MLIKTSPGSNAAVNLNDYKIVAGTNSLKSGGTSYDVLSVLVHPNYNKMNFDFDFVLFKTTQKIAIGKRFGKLLKIVLS